MKNYYETIVIGGGQAGLSASYYLQRNNREHIVLERSGYPGNVWRVDRWDSFSLLTPNWAYRLPGAEYAGPNREGFMPLAEITSRFDGYVLENQLPVQFYTEVQAVDRTPEGERFQVRTNKTTYLANNVIVATGLFQKPKLPAYYDACSKDILQIHTGQYRNPQALPAGAVMVVGSGQSGSQIVDELVENGRQVYLSVGACGRVPRRYRGKDSFEWLYLCGFFDNAVGKLGSPEDKFRANPQVSGRNGGKAINLHQFVRDGVQLLGHIQNIQNHKAWFAPDLKQILTHTDNFEKETVKMFDQYIEANGLDAPYEELPQLDDGYRTTLIEELDLKSSGIRTIIWGAGYSYDFSLVHLPVFDTDGFPVQNRGVTNVPGLFFLGLPWLHKRKSGLLMGVGEDADYIVSLITGQTMPSETG